MADHDADPHDDKVETVPLPPDEGDGADRVIAQENQSAEVAVGGGEWPSPDAPPTGPSPGGTPDANTAGLRPPGQPVDGPPPGSVTEPELQQDGRAAGDTGAARAGDAGLSGGDAPGEFPPIKDVLENEPVTAGSQSVPRDDDGDQVAGGTKFA